MKTYRPTENQQLSQFKKQLRKNMTKEEVILWQHLRRHQQSSDRIRRQVVFGKYIVDFACLPKKLIIELDGSQHFEPLAIAYDQHRTEYLNRLGFTVLRFTNAEIRFKLNDVLETIYQHLK